MNVEIRDPQAKYDFGQATTAWFNTSGGKDYALRLWFWHSAVIFVVFLVTVPFLMPVMAEFSEASWIYNRAVLSNDTEAPIAYLSSVGNALPIYGLFMLGIWISSALGEAAFYRKYLTGEEPARLPIRFNAFTMRNMLVQLGFYVLMFFVTVLLSMLAGIIGGVFGFLSPVLGAAVVVFAVISVIIFALVVFPVRVACAAALTALTKKVHILSAKNITKRRFWPLFGAYLVTYVGGYIAYYIVYMIVLIAVSGNPDFITAISGLGTDNPSIVFQAMFERLSNPLIMFVAVLGMAALAAAWSGWMLWIAGVSAYAVKLWVQDDPTAAFE